MPRKCQPRIEIKLRDCGLSYDRIYTNNDQIEGEIVLQVEQHANIRNLEVAFVGRATITIPNLQPWAYQHASRTQKHTFLHIRQQLTGSVFKDASGDESRVIHRAPFSFTIPDKLLPGACQHGNSPDHVVVDEHIHLPPSLDAKTTSKPTFFATGIPPENVSIKYSVLVRARTEFDGETRICEGAATINIIPTAEKSIQPPGYTKTAIPNSNLFIEHRCSTQMGCGRLLASINPYCAIRVPSTPKPGSTAMVTSLTIHLRFEPQERSSLPPGSLSVQSKIHVYTYASLRPFKVTPTPSDFSGYKPGEFLSRQVIPVAGHDVGFIHWQAHSTCRPRFEEVSPDRKKASISMTTEPLGRTRSARLEKDQAGTRVDNETSESCAFPDSSTTSIYYTASLTIPISLPRGSATTSTVAIPTFESCLACRNYMLEVKILPEGRKRFILIPEAALVVVTPLRIYAGCECTSACEHYCSF